MFESKLKHIQLWLGVQDDNVLLSGYICCMTGKIMYPVSQDPISALSRVYLLIHGIRLGSYAEQMQSLEEALVTLNRDNTVTNMLGLNTTLSSLSTISRLRDSYGNTAYHIASAIGLPGEHFTRIKIAMEEPDRLMRIRRQSPLPFSIGARFLPRLSAVARIPLIGPLSVSVYGAAIRYSDFSRADINTPNILGETPLHTAVRLGQLDAIQFFLNNGANSNATNLEGNTALHVAIKHGVSTAIEVLLRATGPMKSSLTAENHQGYTPYLYALHCLRGPDATQCHYQALLAFITHLDLQDRESLRSQMHTSPTSRLTALLITSPVENDLEIAALANAQSSERVLRLVQALHNHEMDKLHSLSTSTLSELPDTAEPAARVPVERHRTLSST